MWSIQSAFTVTSSPARAREASTTIVVVVFQSSPPSDLLEVRAVVERVLDLFLLIEGWFLLSPDCNDIMMIF